MEENIVQRSWKNFDFHPLILRCLIEKNFNTPTEIQSQVLPYTKQKLDLIIASKTVLIMIIYLSFNVFN